MESSMQPMSAQIENGARGFFSRLFDTSFKSFITGDIIKWIFILNIAGAVLLTLGVIVGSLTINAGLGVVVLILSPIVFLWWVIWMRVYLELIVILFRIEENTRG